MDGSLSDLVCALLSRGAALPRWIRAISQDRNRGRCDHDPILVEFVKKCMCGVNKAKRKDVKQLESLSEVKQIRFNPGKRRATREPGPWVP